MQERYLGDIHDFYKFLFIKQLSTYFNIKIGLNWYLINPRDLGVKELLLNDGEKRTYLKDNHARKIDLKLHNEMETLKSKKNRILGDFVKQTHIIKYADFFSKTLTPFNRKAWLKSSFEFYKKYEFIFLDPDNGLEPPKAKISDKKKIKYILNGELKKLFKLGKTICFCQFQAFNLPHKILLEKKRKQLFDLCGIRLKLPILRNRVAPNTFYIIITPDKNINKIEAFLLKYVDSIPKTELVYI
tara:strand:- start:565 stop:1293 length:729 start_codon:yes stop_codon:yes gene_type:complete